MALEWTNEQNGFNLVTSGSRTIGSATEILTENAVHALPYAFWNQAATVTITVSGNGVATGSAQFTFGLGWALEGTGAPVFKIPTNSAATLPNLTLSTSALAAGSNTATASVFTDAFASGGAFPAGPYAAPYIESTGAGSPFVTAAWNLNMWGRR